MYIYIYIHIYIYIYTYIIYLKQKQNVGPTRMPRITNLGYFTKGRKTAE